MSAAVPLLRVAILVVWLLSPAILAGFALFRFKRAQNPNQSLLIALVLLVDWVLFVVFLIRSQTPYGGYLRPSWRTDILLFVALVGLIASVAATSRKWRLFVGNVALVTLWVCIAYAPSHWLRQVDFGSVTVDGHPVAATVYFGHPTDSEAEAVALVRLQEGGDYFLDFGSEKVRDATRSDYVRLPGGVWCLRAMQKGAFREPLPPRQLNQFRIASDGRHIVVVQF